MKKLLGIIVLGLLLSGCMQNMREITKMSPIESEKMIYDRDFRTNLFEGDVDILYIDTRAISILGKPSLSERTSYINLLTGKVYMQSMFVTAKRICKREMGKDAANFLGTRIVTKDEIKKFKLFGIEYDFFKCTKSQKEIKKEKQKKKDIAKAKKEKEIKKKKKQNISVSNNTRNISYVCSYKFNSRERSKIKIRGATATEITAAGISINYSVVELTSKGAFNLEGSSKAGRAWFIGASSFLFLDANPLPYDCK